MERQKLMGDSESRNLIVSRLKYDSTSDGQHCEEQSFSLIDKGKIVDRRKDSERIDKKDKSNIMTVFSDLFGVKSNSATNRRDSSVSLSTTTVIFMLSVLFTICLCVDATPVNSGKQSSLFSLTPSARNIRHLPCISRKTKQEGVCMFAIECFKANGTHLGTCIDRFYFGSCCQMPEDVPPITDNHIEDNSIFGQNYHKPQGVKGDQDDKVDNSLNALSSSSSSTSQSTSQKTVNTTPSSQKTPKPTKVSTVPTTTQQSVQKTSATSTKPPSRKPTFSSNRPTFSTQKYGSTSQKFNTTTKQENKETTTKKPEVTSHTRRPYPSTGSNVYKKPITTGVIVNNTIYTGVLPVVNNTKPSINATKDNQPNKSPELMPSLKPMRNTTIYNVIVLSTTTTSTPKPFYLPSRYTTSTTTSTTTTPKPFYLPSKFTTTQRPKNVTQSKTEAPTTTVKLSTTQYVQETKKTTAKIQETTTEAIKLSTFHSVQGEETKKPTSVTKKPLITGKPTPSPSLGPHLPFGTRLPSGSSSSHKPSTYNKPTTVQISQTKPISTPADTIPPIILTPTRPTHKPLDKPTASQRPERPTSKPENNTDTTERPLVQRPQNSTLSNRRPTIKPTPPFKKPEPTSKPENVTSIEPTKKPTTIIYRPSVETRPSLKPTYISQKPSEETPKPTTSITFRPSTTYNRRPTTTENSTQETTITTAKPVNESYRPTSSWSPTKRPPTFTSTLNITRYRPTSPSPNTTVLSETTTLSSSAASSTTTIMPISSLKPSTVTKKPLVKPSSTPIPVKPSTVTRKPVISSIPTINHIDGATSQKPTTLTQKPLIISTTESVGFVTWTNSWEPAVTQSPQINTTQKDEELSSAAPSEGWVILQTISPPNGSVSTVQSSNTISSSNKPTYTGPTRRPSPTTTIASTPMETSTRRTQSTTTRDGQTTLEVTTKETILYSTSKPIEQSTRKPVSQTTRKPVFEITTRTPIESTTKTSTIASVFSTKPIFTVLVTTKPLQKPSTVNVTEQPSLEFSTFMSVSGGPTTKPSVTIAEKNVTSAQFGADGTNETVTETTQTYSNGTTTQSGTTLNTTTASDRNTTTTASSATNTTTSPLDSTTSGSVSTESFNMSDFREVCGRRLWPEARVVGGTKANFGRWPWQVSLRQWRTSTYLHKCGAALLSDNWAITAAHCVDNVAPSDLLLRLGEHDLAGEDEPYGYQERRVQIVASHPQFDPRTFEYDLALLRFYEPVNFQPNILPVCVPTNDEGFVGKTAYVTGWGRLYEDGPLPSVLQEVRVPVLENEDCEQMYRSAGYIEHIPHIFICAGWRKGGFDSCEGDSGGPLVLQRDDNRFQLAGIISWGIGCAEPNQPGVYTRISEFRDWINQILQF